MVRLEDGQLPSAAADDDAEHGAAAAARGNGHAHGGEDREAQRERANRKVPREGGVGVKAAASWSSRKSGDSKGAPALGLGSFSLFKSPKKKTARMPLSSIDVGSEEGGEPPEDDAEVIHCACLRLSCVLSCPACGVSAGCGAAR
jgi:hypothetical protein